MPSVLERAIAQFADRATFSVDVPEWADPPGSPFTVYFKAPTLATLSKVNSESAGDPVKAMAMVVAQCALDEKGERLFNNMAWSNLFREVDPAIVQRIADAIMGKVRLDAPAVEAAEKN